MRTPISRRTLLRGMLGGAAVGIALPTLEIFLNEGGTAHADGSALPKRFGVFFWGNGMLPDRWVPGTQGLGWEPSQLLQPLSDMRDAVSVVSGMRVMTGNPIAHGGGPAGILSGAPLRMRGDEAWTFTSPSVDQLAAASIGGETRFRSLETGVVARQGLSFNGLDSRNPPETSPHRLFERVFGAGFRAPGDDTIDPSVGLRRSVLDVVTEEAHGLRGRLGASDAHRLDEHLDGIRELERRLARIAESPPMLDACASPEAPPPDIPLVDGRPQVSVVHRAITDVLVMALACDQTRVFGHYFTDPGDNTLYPGASSGFHQLTHDEPGDQPEVQLILTSIMEDLAHFLAALRAVPEGDGSLLDHSAVLCTTDCSYGRTHAIDDYPILLAGSASGALRTGIHHRSAGENTSKLLLSVLRAVGVPLAELGAEGGRVSDGLGAIES